LSKSRQLKLESEIVGARATGASAIGTSAIGSVVIGALAMGALAIGALAIGRLMVGRLMVGRARILRVEIDDLVVRRLRITEEMQVPDNPEPSHLERRVPATRAISAAQAISTHVGQETDAGT
jgi:hypothetical protein